MRPDSLRIAVLRNALEPAVASLYRRRASEIPEGYIDDFVELDWLEWHGGGLRLTTTGDNIRLQNRAHPKAAAAASAQIAAG